MLWVALVLSLFSVALTLFSDVVGFSNLVPQIFEESGTFENFQTKIKKKMKKNKGLNALPADPLATSLPL